MTGLDKRLLAVGSAQAEQLRRDAVPDWAAGRQADTMIEVAKTDRVLYVDQHAFVELTRHHHQDIMGRTTMMPWAPGEPIGDARPAEALKAGREAVAWCSWRVRTAVLGQRPQEQGKTVAAGGTEITLHRRGGNPRDGTG